MSKNNSECELDYLYTIDCPNMKAVQTESWDYEMYKCEVCGKYLTAYYEDMK